jgi:hypothetical protein
MVKPTFNFELTKYKKSESNPLLIQQHFAEIRTVTSEYSAIYTDGSKDGDRIASAAVFGQQVMNLLFSEEATNFKARSIALASALKIELADGIRAE